MSCSGGCIVPVRSTGRARSLTRAIFARFWGLQTGPSPVDRGRAGSEHHLLTDATGLPLAFTLTAANRRHHAVVAAGREDQAAARPAGTASQTPGSGNRRPRLRQRQAPPRASPARHQARDRPPRHRTRFRTRRLPLGDRAQLQLAAPVPAAAHPLRTRPPNARSVHAPRLRNHLLAPTHLIMKQPLRVSKRSDRKPTAHHAHRSDGH
jgi:hypothetical protein